MRLLPSAGGAWRIRERGATTVEFALVLPLLIAVVFGTIEAGRMVVARAMLSYVTIAGARTAAVTGTTSIAAVQTSIIAAAPMLHLATSDIDVAVGGVVNSGPAFTGRTAGATVAVTVRYTFRPVVSVAANIITKSWSETDQTRVGE